MVNKNSTPSAFRFSDDLMLENILNTRLASTAPVGDLVDKTTQKVKISANDSTGFKRVMLSIIGDYETTITDYKYQSGSSGYYSHSINIERDWSWICSICLFGVMVFCCIRAVVAILCRK